MSLRVRLPLLHGAALGLITEANLLVLKLGAMNLRHLTQVHLLHGAAPARATKVINLLVRQQPLHGAVPERTVKRIIILEETTLEITEIILEGGTPKVVVMPIHGNPFTNNLLINNPLTNLALIRTGGMEVNQVKAKGNQIKGLGKLVPPIHGNLLVNLFINSPLINNPPPILMDGMEVNQIKAKDKALAIPIHGNLRINNPLINNPLINNPLLNLALILMVGMEVNHIKAKDNQIKALAIRIHGNLLLNNLFISSLLINNLVLTLMAGMVGNQIKGTANQIKIAGKITRTRTKREDINLQGTKMAAAGETGILNDERISKTVLQENV